MTEHDLVESLIQRIWTNPEFHTDVNGLYFQNLNNSILHRSNIGTYNESKIIQLLQSAVILSLSDSIEHRTTAYRIAVSLFNLYRGTFPNIHTILHIVFGNLGNFPAIDFLYKTTQTEKQYEMPSAVLLDILNHEYENTVKLGEDEVLLTEFQHHFWQSLTNNKNSSVSATTSAGKSFALQRFLISEIINDRANLIVYMVPTRALIGQVSENLGTLLKTNSSKIQISTIPASPADLSIEKGIYVLTQERLYVLLADNPAIKFDIVVVDEAQTIADGSRGVLLQLVLEKLLDISKETRFLFGAALISNPPYFSSILEQEVFPVPEVFESPVAQNLVSIDIVQNTVPQAEVKFRTDDSSWFNLGTVDLQLDNYDDRNILAYTSYYFGRESKNIVYVGSPAACENIADRIRQYIDLENGNKSETSENIPDSIRDLSSFIRDHIHPEYFLADMVERGVGFHFGKMPTLLRKAIENEYSNNSFFKHLVCTSTLLHGVNLPAKNMFILKPSEGDKWLGKNADPMDSPSFWNLAGRAGRLGKDFEGNVFLINKDSWDYDPLMGNREHAVHASFYDVIRENKDTILSLAKSEVEALSNTQENNAIESTFIKLYTDFRKGRLPSIIKKSPSDIPDIFIEELQLAFSELQFDIPDEILENNISIPPLRQQRMLEYQYNKIKQGNEDDLIPLHPESKGAQTSYIRLFRRFQLCFDGLAKSTKAADRLGIIASRWMKGIPYPELIKSQQKYSPNSSIPVVVRTTMETIEDEIRFTLVQRTRCYLDLLQYAFQQNGLSDKLSSVPSLPLFLEVGACSGTMINLIGLGFTRTTAGLINQKSVNQHMNRVDSLKWLSRERWESSDLPRVCINEISEILSSNQI